MYNRQKTDRSGRRRAFTMMELLVVIAIIATLVGILIPSVTAARTSARVVHTKTLITTLETALNAFKADQTIGGGYPASYYRPAIDKGPWETGPYSIWGAQMLTWSVVGADLLGIPGFGDGDLNELYLKKNDGTPTYPRRLFADPGKLTIKRPDECKIANKLDYGDADNRVRRTIPVILDHFELPILFYSRNPAPTENEMELNFVRGDNEPFTDATDSFENDSDFNEFTFDPRTEQFGGAANARQHNYDTFLLLSAGPDLKYGTADDVANFSVPINP